MREIGMNLGAFSDLPLLRNAHESLPAALKDTSTY
jgi:hypothetical protein